MRRKKTAYLDISVISALKSTCDKLSASSANFLQRALAIKAPPIFDSMHVILYTHTRKHTLIPIHTHTHTHTYTYTYTYIYIYIYIYIYVYI